MNKKQLYLLLLISLLLCLLTGCQQAPRPEPIQITLMHGWGGVGADHVAMRKIYEDFNALNPDIDLVYDASPDSSVVMEKAMNMLALDEMPDIISTNGNGQFVSGAVRKGLALDLMPFLQEDASFASCVSDQTLRTWQTDTGALYTLPDAREIAGYWYNEDILLAAGIITHPASWDDFWDCLDKINTWSKENGMDILPIHLNESQASLLLGAILASKSPEGEAYMQGEREWCNPELWGETLRDVAKAYLYGEGSVPSDNDAREKFFEGKTAFYLNGVWANISLEQTQNQQIIKCAAYPGGKGKTIAYITPSSGYVVGNTGSQEKIKACVRFVKYMLSEDVQRRIVSETQQAPSNPNVDTAWITSQVPVLGQALGNCYAADVHIINFPTLLDEKANLALGAYLADPSPSAHDTDLLQSILTQSPSERQ